MCSRRILVDCVGFLDVKPRFKPEVERIERKEI